MRQLMFNIYVLNLPRATKRLKLISKILSALELEFKVVSGVDGKELSEGTNEIQFSKILHKKLSPAEVGCYLSHKKAWQMISEGDKEFGVVLEDDAVFGERLKNFLIELEKSDFTFDVLHVEDVGKRDSRFITTKDSERIFNEVSVYRLLSPAIFAGALVISKEGARKLLSLSSTKIEPTDELLFNIYSPLYKELETYQTSEVLAWQSYQLSSEIKHLVSSSIPKGKVNRRTFGSTIHGLRKLILKSKYLIGMSLLRNKKEVEIGKNELEKKYLARLYLHFLKNEDSL